MVTETMLDRSSFARWFGLYASAPKYPELDWRPGEAGHCRGHARTPRARSGFAPQPGQPLLLHSPDGRFAPAVRRRRMFRMRSGRLPLSPSSYARATASHRSGAAKSEPAMGLIVTLFNQAASPSPRMKESRTARPRPPAIRPAGCRRSSSRRSAIAPASASEGPRPRSFCAPAGSSLPLWSA